MKKEEIREMKFDLKKQIISAWENDKSIKWAVIQTEQYKDIILNAKKFVMEILPTNIANYILTEHGEQSLYEDGRIKQYAKSTGLTERYIIKILNKNGIRKRCEYKRINKKQSTEEQLPLEQESVIKKENISLISEVLKSDNETTIIETRIPEQDIIQQILNDSGLQAYEKQFLTEHFKNKPEELQKFVDMRKKCDKKQDKSAKYHDEDIEKFNHSLQSIDYKKGMMKFFAGIYRQLKEINLSIKENNELKKKILKVL